jgi:hypothetical protein
MTALYAVLGLLALLIAVMAINTVFRSVRRSADRKGPLPELTPKRWRGTCVRQRSVQTVTAPPRTVLTGSFSGPAQDLEKLTRLHTALEKEKL